MTVDPRHSRNALFAGIGIEGQERLYAARVAVVGCGALGSHAAELLARAGVGRGEGGFLRIIDRDYVDVTNLQRQTLFDTEDAEVSRPKAVAAAAHLRRIDSAVNCQPFVRDLTPSNFRTLLRDAEIIVDATDNFRTRFLINDAAVELGIPWIYGGAVASRGISGTIVPGTTPCLRCYLEAVPAFGTTESCETAGIITPLPSLIASLQVAQALRLLVNGTFPKGLLLVDLWTGISADRRFETFDRDPECPSCGTRELPSLRGDSEQTVTLCGRNSVQFHSDVPVDLAAAARQLATVAEVDHHAVSVTARLPHRKLTLFEDGRIIVEGTTDPLEARSLVARYLGG